MQKIRYIILLIVTVVLLAAQTSVAFASTTAGTIESGHGFAWSDQQGWINFSSNSSGGNIIITDAAVTGYAWSINGGWINLEPTKGGVTNNGEGVLAGNAWGEQVGWIDFSGVIINGAGKFSGSAHGDLIGTLSFDCAQCDVRTDWRPASTRIVKSSEGSSGNAESSGITGVGKENDGQVTNTILDTGEKPKDEEKPVASSKKDAFFINKGKSYTTQQTVKISFQSENVESVEISNDSDFSNAKKIPFRSIISWRLTKEKGLKTIYIKLHKKDGTVSDVLTSSIYYATKKQTLIVVKPPQKDTKNTSSAKSVSAPLFSPEQTFNRNLNIGSKGSDVTILQKFLNSNGFLLAPSGIGSRGMESNYFGSLTAAALSLFQKQYNLEEEFGTLGPKTRQFLNDLVNKKITFACTPYLTSYIMKDGKNDSGAIKKLQKFLHDQAGFTKIKETGIYDNDSMQAVIVFQERYSADILTPWKLKRGTGNVSVTTLRKINNVMCENQ